jgi:hypothetical protein
VEAAEVSQESAVKQALEWVAGNPLMSGSKFAVSSVQIFPGSGDYSVYAVELSPAGYLILNSDDRLSLVVCFSADSSLDLSDDPQNALRAMLLDYCEETADALAGWVTTATIMSTAVATSVSEDELYGPFLETSWNQNDPYNLLCPDDPSGSEYYGYRVPSGCVPTAYAQILMFHRWPVAGIGSRSYTDSSGSTTGSHSADFSDTYDWANMLAAHSTSDSLAEQAAIGELMFELGVAAGANYESDGTGASTYTLGSRLGDYFLYEPIEYSDSQSSLITPLEADLRAGFPCVVSIPGHAIVADGLMVFSGQTTYHINYGWGGSNNGWWSATGIPGGALESGITSLRPRLMAFPETNAVSAEASGSAEVRWILPKHRAAEAAQLEILRYDDPSGDWESFAVDTDLFSRAFSAVISAWDDCDDLSVFENTSTSDYKDWVISTDSGVTSCFYKEPGGYSNREYHLTSSSTITPTASTRLLLVGKYTLYQDTFSISVSTDGSSFSEVWSAAGSLDWGEIAVDLSDYAGQPIKVRLEYSSGSYYSSGGVWIDSVSTQEVTNPELEGQPVHYTTLSGLLPGTNTLAAVLTDSEGVEHAMGPAFILVVSGSANDADSDGLPDDWELEFFAGETSADPTAIASNGVNTVMEAYVAGLNPTDPRAFFEVELSNDTAGYVVEWVAVPGRVYSVWSTTNLVENFQPLETDIYWPRCSWTGSVDAVEQFYRVDVELE